MWLPGPGRPYSPGWEALHLWHQSAGARPERCRQGVSGCQDGFSGQVGNQPTDRQRPGDRRASGSLALTAEVLLVLTPCLSFLAGGSRRNMRIAFNHQPQGNQGSKKHTGPPAAPCIASSVIQHEARWPTSQHGMLAHIQEGCQRHPPTGRKKRPPSTG